MPKVPTLASTSASSPPTASSRKKTAGQNSNRDGKQSSRDKAGTTKGKAKAKAGPKTVGEMTKADIDQERIKEQDVVRARVGEYVPLDVHSLYYTFYEQTIDEKVGRLVF